MLKNGKEALLVAFITGLFSILSVFIKDQNPIIAIVAIAVIVGTVYVIISKAMTRIKDSIGSPASHPVFFTIDNGIKIAFNYLPIIHEKKKKLVVLYLKTKFTLIRDALTLTIEDDDIHELPSRIMNAVSSTREKMQGRAPDLFISKMAAWDNKHNAWTTDALASIVDSNFYGDKNMKFSACFDCVQVMLKSTFIAVECTIQQMNGELEAYLEGRDDV